MPRTEYMFETEREFKKEVSALSTDKERGSFLEQVLKDLYKINRNMSQSTQIDTMVGKAVDAEKYVRKHCPNFPNYGAVLEKILKQKKHLIEKYPLHTQDLK